MSTSPAAGPGVSPLQRGWPLADDRGTLVKQVKEANDIVEVVGSYISLRPVGKSYKGLCPFHDDHNPSFQVDPHFQNYRCWSCNKYGDVITFVQEFEKVEFREALELLARRAGITLEKKGAAPHDRSRAFMLDIVRWAADQYHRCLLEIPLAEAARRYLGERGLSGETVRRFTLGFAPPAGDWLVRLAANAGHPADLLEKVGLIARRTEGNGYYDRFRDRVMFPIRDVRGQPVGFGGRILPSSESSARTPKYINSADTPLFNKSENLYGIDQARQAGQKAGYLAVVEGYTDVLMAHQMGVPQVVATMGTALNTRHVQNLRRAGVSRVVLVFDADAGGATGVDRALEIFVSQDVDLAVATLPEGLDPCDLLLKQGPDAFRARLDGAVDALEFKLNQVLAAGAGAGVEGRRRAVDAVLGVIALAPEMGGHGGQVKRELAVSRVAQRLGIQEETVWARLNEMRARRQQAEANRQKENGLAFSGPPTGTGRETASGKAAAHERELLELLLAEPALVPAVAAEVRPEEVEHPGPRRLLEILYALHAEGEPPDLDQVRARLDDPGLAEAALKLQLIGRRNPHRAAWLQRLLAEFRKRRLEPRRQELQNQLHAAPDHAAAVELLRQLQEQTVGSDPAASDGAGTRS
jgi:DNA primase